MVTLTSCKPNADDERKCDDIERCQDTFSSYNSRQRPVVLSRLKRICISLDLGDVRDFLPIVKKTDLHLEER